MANPSKKKGSSFESAFVRYMRGELGDDRPERTALHGNKDMGDVHGLHCHGWHGVAECKDHRKVYPSDIEKWKGQTIRERENAGADFALLVVHEPGCGEKSFGRNSCYMQLRDLEMVTDGIARVGESARDIWVRVTVGDLVRMIRGEFGGKNG